jgi:hypothetical protein
MLCGLINVGARNSDTNLNDQTNYSSREKKYFDEIIQFAANKGINLSAEQLAALQIPNTPMATETYSWMDFYFNLLGDSIPNSDGEIHLEPISILTIYKEYKDDMIKENYNHNAKDVYTETEFAKLWKVCFPHVMIREFKAVTGKCNTCAHFSDVRRKCGDKKRKQELTWMRALHRTAYMGERLGYSNRREEVKQFPQKSLSIISDGMAQSHCILPHLGNLTSFGTYARCACAW